MPIPIPRFSNLTQARGYYAGHPIWTNTIFRKEEEEYKSNYEIELENKPKKDVIRLQKEVVELQKERIKLQNELTKLKNERDKSN